MSRTSYYLLPVSLQDLDHGGGYDPTGFVMFQGAQFSVAGHEKLGMAGFGPRQQITVLVVQSVVPSEVRSKARRVRAGG